MNTHTQIDPTELHATIKLGIDAHALCQRLDRFTRGNRKAFSIVRVPSEDEERDRAFTRQRPQIVRERQHHQAMGRSHQQGWKLMEAAHNAAGFGSAGQVRKTQGKANDLKKWPDNGLRH